MTNVISEVTRRNIADYIAAAPIDWAGRLSEPDFLSRMYDLTALPSFDGRFKDAAGDIYKHRIMNSDWEDDWVFTDSRFNLIRASDDDFLRFLSETVHPVVRPDADRAREIVAAYNQELQADGWKLEEGTHISGRPVFRPLKIHGRAEVFKEPTGWQKVDRQIQEARLRLETANQEEQFQAVGLICREALISVAQAVFDPSRHVSTDGITASNADAKRMLESFFAVELAGSVDEEVRSHARASLRLALALQHRRTANFRMAALCAEATTSVVNQVAVLSGRRDRLR